MSCPLCGPYPQDCRCAPNTAPTPAVELACETCGLDAPFECFTDCLKCAAAYVVARPEAWASNLGYYIGAPWLPVFEREVERQRVAVLSVPQTMRRQVGA